MSAKKSPITQEQIEKMVQDAVAQAIANLSGDNIVGGIIQQFGSTGIQDNASACQVTILDEATVVENKLVALEAEIKGDLTVDGDIILSGEIPSDSPFYRDLVQHAAGLLKLSLDDKFFEPFAIKIIDSIRTHGIDLNKITSNNKEILNGNRLGHFITDSNLQKLGELKSLVVNGETALSKTIFTKNKRVGINTEDPAGALAIWDEECEIVARKLRKDVSVFGSLRNQKVVLSANSKDNLVLETDGSVTIEKLTVGTVHLSSAAACPTYDAKLGTIVFNEKPDVGSTIGWVSLGSARWGKIGIIS